jgi:hypothetical protein
MPSALQTLLQNPAIWRGANRHAWHCRAFHRISVLDRELPGRNSAPHVPSAEQTRGHRGCRCSFALATLSRETAGSTSAAWTPYAPALAPGVQLSKLIVVKRMDKDTMWAASRACAPAVLRGARTARRQRGLRRLHLLPKAASELFGDAVRASPSSPALRIGGRQPRPTSVRSQRRGMIHPRRFGWTWTPAQRSSVFLPPHPACSREALQAKPRRKDARTREIRQTQDTGRCPRLRNGPPQ